MRCVQNHFTQVLSIVAVACKPISGEEQLSRNHVPICFSALLTYLKGCRRMFDTVAWRMECPKGALKAIKDQEHFYSGGSPSFRGRPNPKPLAGKWWIQRYAMDMYGMLRYACSPAPRCLAWQFCSLLLAWLLVATSDWLLAVIVCQWASRWSHLSCMSRLTIHS